MGPLALSVEGAEMLQQQPLLGAVFVSATDGLKPKVENSRMAGVEMEIVVVVRVICITDQSTVFPEERTLQAQRPVDTHVSNCT
jgi:hypothetical protein